MIITRTLLTNAAVLSGKPAVRSHAMVSAVDSRGSSVARVLQVIIETLEQRIVASNSETT